MKRMWSVFVVMLALCLALTGCGGNKSSSGDPAPQKPTSTSETTAEPSAEADLGADFKGSWELVSMVQEGEETSEEDMQAMKEFGYCVYLDLNEDGTAALDMFGEIVTGTWEAKEQDSATLSMGGDPAKIRLADGLLVMSQSDSSLTFKHIDPSEKVVQSEGGDQSEAYSSGAQYFGGDTIDDLDEVTNIDKLIVDDDTCTIKAVAAGDYVGDPGILFEITNKTDADILVMDGNDWAIDGTAHKSTFYEVIRAGETLGSIGWFDASELADGEALANITGSLYLYDANDTSIEITHYDFAL